ncbi:chitin deacetylase [Linnemannia exigua]|uniref:Chitin deacetylase n=1 Tax=Linnemannia exigua TaxID=604196 RepID=A0AAD4DKQ0_9FUNG|nr:chitin deacetylase [Linnemannia exigua]
MAPLYALRNSDIGNSWKGKLSPILLYTAVVCFFANTIPLTTAVLNKAEFPPGSVVPKTDHPLVQQWLSEIDLTGVPLINLNEGEPPECPAKVAPGVCYWTCEDCAGEDVVECPDKNVWGLTFDDGPTPATPELLNYLDQQQVKATFFLIGANVVEHPEMVVREAAAGHHLASHTWSHHALTTLTNEEIVAEIKWTEKAILDATGLRVRYMRPPYGDVDNRVRMVLKKLGYTVVDWGGDTFDSNDWKIPEISKSAVVAHLEHSITNYAANANNTKGFITLEHDHTIVTVEVAKSLIPFGKKQNLQIMSVADCLHDSSPYGVAANVAVTSPSINTPPPATAPVQDAAAGNSTSQDSGTNGPKADDLDLAASYSGAATAAVLWSSGIVMGSFIVAAGLALL